MSRHMIRFRTMVLVLKLPPICTAEQIVKEVSYHIFNIILLQLHSSYHPLRNCPSLFEGLRKMN